MSGTSVDADIDRNEEKRSRSMNPNPSEELPSILENKEILLINNYTCVSVNKFFLYGNYRVEKCRRFFNFPVKMTTKNN